MSGALQMQVACETPLGVEFATLQTAGKGGVIVTERLVEKFAEARGWRPDECELILVTEQPSGRVMWRPPNPHSEASSSGAQDEA